MCACLELLWVAWWGSHGTNGTHSFVQGWGFCLPECWEHCGCDTNLTLHSKVSWGYAYHGLGTFEEKLTKLATIYEWARPSLQHFHNTLAATTGVIGRVTYTCSRSFTWLLWTCATMPRMLTVTTRWCCKCSKPCACVINGCGVCASSLTLIVNTTG